MKNYFTSSVYPKTIIPFAYVIRVYDERNIDERGVVVNQTDIIETTIKGDDADRFLAEYTAWLDAQPLPGAVERTLNTIADMTRRHYGQ